MKRHCYLLLCALLLPVSAAAVDYTYDSLDRLKRVGYDDGKSIAYDYDAAGNLLKVTSVAQPSWCNQTVNFDGNVVPSNWSLALIRSGPGIRNNRLESQVTDSGSRIDAAAAVMAAGVGRIVVEYRALHVPSTWGIVSGIEFVDPAVGRWGFWLDNSTYHYPNRMNFRVVRGGTLFGDARDNASVYSANLADFTYGEHRVRVEIQDGSMRWVLTNVATGRETVMTSALPADFHVAGLRTAHSYIYTTTDNASWLDDLNIQCLPL